MKNLSRHSRAVAKWSAAPLLHISDESDRGDYRLTGGRVEFRPADTQNWRSLAYSEIQQHMLLRTPVAKWLSQLYTAAKLAKVLAD